MSKSSHLELHDTDSEVALGHLDSVSLPSEPPDIKNWFSSYIYESPELDASDGFQDSDVAGESCPGEESNGKSGNPVGGYDDACAAQLKLSHGVESESLPFSAEPPDIRNWFSSYIYESLPLDTACDFAIPNEEEMEDGKLYVGEKSSSGNRKDLMASVNVEKIGLCTQMNTSEAVVNGPNTVEDTKLDHQYVCKEDDDVACRPLSSTPSPLSSVPILSEQRAGYSSHNSFEKNGSTIYPASVNMKNNVGSQDGKPDYSSIEDGLENEDIYTTVSPRTTDKIVAVGDSWGTPADGRSIAIENEATELLEDGFISVRKKRSRANDENAVRRTNGVKPMTKHEKDGHIVRKVLSEISNSHYQNIVGSTGKWSCPQKNKPELGPPLKQLRLDQWVRRV